MESTVRSTAVWVAAVSTLALAGCATQQAPLVVKDAPQSAQVQKQMQNDVALAATTKPVLKRKIALGRVTNETAYGKSLLRDNAGDPVGKQIADMLSKALTESGAFVVLERTDVSKLQDENKLTGVKQDLVGVDALVLGSLTEFGRKTVGETGFVSSSKKQVAFAKIDLRVVDVASGQSLFVHLRLRITGKL
jgi:curli biogenesis system outer membrane secretion channel CsgG